MTTCKLSQSDNYTEFLSLRPIEALPGHCELLIQSQWLGAKNPSGLQVKHRAIVSVSALEELRDMIWKALSD
jgi:hypothetical protein